MIVLLAALLTFVLAGTWVLLNAETYGVPLLVLRWVEGYPWGQKPWWGLVTEWFAIPLIFLALFLVFWLCIRVILGSPRATLRRRDWCIDAEIPESERGLDAFRDRAWFVLFKFLILRRGKTWASRSDRFVSPWRAVLLMTMAGCVFILVGVVGNLLPEFVFSGRSHPSLFLATVLVFWGLVRTHATVKKQAHEAENDTGRDSSTGQGLLQLSSKESSGSEADTEPAPRNPVETDQGQDGGPSLVEQGDPKGS